MSLDQIVNSAIRERHEMIGVRVMESQDSSIYEQIEKARQAQEGEIRTHGGRKMKKVGGKWVPVAERKTPPNQKEKSENKSGKKETSSKKKYSMPPHMSRHHIGVMRHVKELVGKKKYHEAHMLAEKLPDEVKHEIPPSIWKDMVKHAHEAGLKEEAEAKKAKADSLKVSIDKVNDYKDKKK